MRHGHLAALASLLTFASTAPAQSPEGTWQGAAIRDGAVLPLSLRFAEGGESVVLDAPSLGLFGRVSGIRRRADRLDIPMGTFSLHLQDRPEAGALRGKLGRRNVNGPFGDVELLRVATPAVPTVLSENLQFTSADGTKLAATMVRPAGDGPYPGILFVQGRSYGSRFNFYCQAVAAARRGMVGLVFDGRGVGQSEGQRGRHTRDQRLEDAIAALQTLRRTPQVDDTKVGMLGHSAGGWVIPVVADRAPPVAFLVLMAGPAGSLAEQQGQVVRELLRRSGNTNDADLQALAKYQHDLVELTVNGAEWDTIEAHVRTSDDRPWTRHADRPTSSDDAELDYFRRNPHDNTDALRETTIPVLGLYGGDDFIVPPEDNARRLRELLTTAGNTDFEIAVFEDANHSLMLAESLPDAQPYRFPRRPPGYDDKLFSWILAHVR